MANYYDDFTCKSASEKDPTGRDQHQPGAKMDSGKIDMNYLQYFPRALRAICLISTYGAKKYTKNGWKEVPNGVERYSSAALRHAIPIDGEYDKSGLLHYAHYAWNVLASLEKQLEICPHYLDKMKEEVFNDN